MKAIKILILNAVFCLVSSMGMSQDLKVYKLKSTNGFCSATISLLKGGKFIYERGCEGTSFICFGEWRKTGNSIQLEPTDNKNFVIIRYFEAAPANDAHSSIKVIDVMGKNMTEKMKYTMLDTFHKEIRTTDNWSEAAANTRFIRLTTLKNIFETSIDIDNINPMNNILQLNIPENYIYNKNSVWELPPVLDYLIASDCLVEKNPKNKLPKYYCFEKDR